MILPGDSESPVCLAPNACAVLSGLESPYWVAPKDSFGAAPPQEVSPMSTVQTPDDRIQSSLTTVRRQDKLTRSRSERGGVSPAFLCASAPLREAPATLIAVRQEKEVRGFALQPKLPRLINARVELERRDSHAKARSVQRTVSGIALPGRPQVILLLGLERPVCVAPKARSGWPRKILSGRHRCERYRHECRSNT